MPKCNQRECEEPGAYRFTWPGRNEDTICEDHVGHLRALAEVMGFHLQVIPLAAREEDRNAE